MIETRGTENGDGKKNKARPYGMRPGGAEDQYSKRNIGGQRGIKQGRQEC